MLQHPDADDEVERFAGERKLLAPAGHHGHALRARHGGIMTRARHLWRRAPRGYDQADYLIEMTVGPALPKSHGGGIPEATNVLGHANTLTLASAGPFLNGTLAGKRFGSTRTVTWLTVGVGLIPSSQTAGPFAKPKPSAIVVLLILSSTDASAPLDMKMSRPPVLGSKTGRHV